MAGVRLLAMQLLCFRRSGYSALQEERLMGPLGPGDPSTHALTTQRPSGRCRQGSSGDGGQAALLVHSSKGQWKQDAVTSMAR